MSRSRPEAHELGFKVDPVFWVPLIRWSKEDDDMPPKARRLMPDEHEPGLRDFLTDVLRALCTFLRRKGLAVGTAVGTRIFWLM